MPFSENFAPPSPSVTARYATAHTQKKNLHSLLHHSIYTQQGSNFYLKFNFTSNFHCHCYYHTLLWSHKWQYVWHDQLLHYNNLSLGNVSDIYRWSLEQFRCFTGECMNSEQKPYFYFCVVPSTNCLFHMIYF